MNSVLLTKELHKSSKRSANRLRSGYEIDFWREVTKRWLVIGVLCTVLLAVITPKVGAVGGLLHTEYTVYLPISYIYYDAGRSFVSFSHVSRRACAIGIAHAHLVAPALAISLSQAIVERDSTNRGLLTGIILSSIGGPCGWLSLSVCPGATEKTRAAAILVCNYVTSLVAEPVSIFILCGRFTHPPLFPTLFSITITTIAFGIGTYHQVSLTRHTSSTNHMISSNNHTMSSENHTMSSDNHTMSSDNHVTSSPNHMTPSTVHNMIPSTYNKTTSPNHITSSPNNMTLSVNHMTLSDYHAMSSTKHMMSSTNGVIPLVSIKTSSANRYTNRISLVNHKTSSANHKVSSVRFLSSSKRAQFCALAALYVECCTRLREAEGELYVTHVFATLILVLGWLCLNVLFCCVYYRSGALTYNETYCVALCSVPKCLDVGWEFGTLCVPTGLSLLPAAFLAPSQALLLAAANRPDGDHSDEEW